MAISDGAISDEAISDAPSTGVAILVSANLTAPLGQIAATVTIVNHLTVPGCVVDLPTGTVP